MRLCRKNVLIGQQGLHLELRERGLMFQASLRVGKVKRHHQPFVLGQCLRMEWTWLSIEKSAALESGVHDSRRAPTFPDALTLWPQSLEN